MIASDIARLAGTRCPAGQEAPRLELTAGLAPKGAKRQLDAVGNLVVSRGEASRTVICPVAEPTFLLTGEGEKTFSFGAFGAPHEAARLPGRAVRLEDGRTAVIGGPKEAKEVAEFFLDIPGGGPPGRAAWAIWPHPATVEGDFILGPGAGHLALAAACLDAARQVEGAFRIVFSGTGFSSRRLQHVLRDGPPGEVAWVATYPARDDVGKGARRLAAPGLPPPAGRAPLHFLGREEVGEVPGLIRSLGHPAHGFGLAVGYEGWEAEVASVTDGVALAAMLAEWMGVGP